MVQNFDQQNSLTYEFVKSQKTFNYLIHLLETTKKNLY